MSANRVHIVGGGVVGLCSAYYLTKAGFEVTVIDASNISDGTSFGNAGMIVPSHFTPLAAPGVIKKGIRWMFDSKSPFYIKPRMSMDLMRWLWKFYRSCNSGHVLSHVALLRDYNQWSNELYQSLHLELGDGIDYHQKGLMMLCKTQKALAEEQEVASMANDIQVEAKVLSAAEVQAKNPDCQIDVLGGIWYPGDGQVYSNQFMLNLRDMLKAFGVRFRYNTKIIDLISSGNAITGLLTDDREVIETAEVVLSAGCWTKPLLKTLGIKLMLQDGRGYSITMEEPASRLAIPSILSEAKVAITPMANHLRITGTLEISNLSKKINHRRVQGFLESVPRYLPSIRPNPLPKSDELWIGYRPCSPDGIPYMGRSKTFSNLIVATGHAMMGMSLGPASGKLVQEIICHEKPSLDLSKMKIER